MLNCDRAAHITCWCTRLQIHNLAVALRWSQIIRKGRIYTGVRGRTWSPHCSALTLQDRLARCTRAGFKDCQRLKPLLPELYPGSRSASVDSKHGDGLSSKSPTAAVCGLPQTRACTVLVSRAAGRRSVTTAAVWNVPRCFIEQPVH